MKPYDTPAARAARLPRRGAAPPNIRKVIAGCDLVTGKLKVKVQDAYSMRSTPQVIGAVHDAMAYARKQVEIELNGVGDNPIFLPEDNVMLTGANFQGTPVRCPGHGRRGDHDGVRAVRAAPEPAAEPGAERGAARVPDQGRRHVLAATCSASTRRTRSSWSSASSRRPSCIQSIPAAADQEDFVSHGHERGPQEPPDPARMPTACSASSSSPPRRRWTSASSRPARACARPRRPCASSWRTWTWTGRSSRTTTTCASLGGWRRGPGRRRGGRRAALLSTRMTAAAAALRQDPREGRGAAQPLPAPPAFPRSASYDPDPILIWS